MATNPMQRKARNSFLAGMFIAILIMGVIVGFLGYTLIQMKKEQKELEASYKTVYILKKNVESGATISMADLDKKQIPANMIPTDYVSADKLTENTIAKINLTTGTVLSANMISESDDKTTNDTRLQEYNMVVLPQNLELDQYIDIRLVLPNGQDFIVVSKKRIVNTDADTIWMNMSEEEIITMSRAIVEAYIMKGSKLYATTYIEPGMQEQATPTYMPDNDIINLINANPNITVEARNKLNEIYTDKLRDIRRQNIQQQLELYREEALDNIEQGVQDEITKMKEARQNYLDALGAAGY